MFIRCLDGERNKKMGSGKMKYILMEVSCHTIVVGIPGIRDNLGENSRNSTTRLCCTSETFNFNTEVLDDLLIKLKS